MVSNCGDRDWMMRMVRARAMREQAESYFKNGGRDTIKLALVLFTQYPQAQYKDIERVVSTAQQIYGGGK